MPWGEEAKARFLALLADCGTFSGAITRMGRTRASAYAERAADPDFARAWDRALACEYEVMETRLVARALGVAEPVAATPYAPGAPAVRPEDLLVMWILSMRAPPAVPAAPAPAAARARRARATGEEATDPAPAAPAVDPAAEAERLEALIAGVAARIAAAESAGKP